MGSGIIVSGNGIRIFQRFRLTFMSLATTLKYLTKWLTGKKNCVLYDQRSQTMWDWFLHFSGVKDKTCRDHKAPNHEIWGTQPLIRFM